MATTYLDQLSQWSNRAIVVIAELAAEAATIVGSGNGDASEQIDKAFWYNILLVGANDTTQDIDVRLTLLTYLVDGARLDTIPDPAGVSNLYQPISPTVVSSVAWALITGNPASNSALTAYILSLIGGSNVFAADVDIVLASGKTYGKYVDGDVAAWNGLTSIEAIIDAVTEYLNPSFTSFTITGQSQLIEAYTIIAAGSKGTTWVTANPSNVEPNTIAIVFVNGYGSGPVTLASGLADDGAQTVTLPTQIQIASGTRTFSITGTKKAPGAGTFTTTFVIVYAFKNFYGVGIIPATSADVRSESSTFGQTFSIVIPAGETEVFFAYPSTHPNITNGSVLYVEGFNSPVGSTFGSPATIAVAMGDAVTTSNYKVYSLTLPVPYAVSATYNVTIPAIP